jgi:hypothetical protein
MASLASINIRFFADLAQFSKQMQNVNRQMKDVSKQLQNTGRSLTIGLTAPLAGLGVLATKTFADFEQEMAKVRAISGATASQFAALEENAKTLGATTRFTASEVAGLQLNFSKLGFNPEEILQVTDATLDLALATGEDLAASATVAASTLRGFGLDASETTRVTDVMAKSFSSSALDLEKFSTAMAIVAPVAKTAGASIEDATGLLSVLVNAGIDASTAGTGLRNIFLDLAQSGLSLEEAFTLINTSSNKNATAMDLFGKRGATVATVLAENIDQAVKFSEAYSGAEGSARAMAEIMDNTLQGSFFRLRSAVEGALIGLGEQLAPVLSSMADVIGELVTRFNNLSPSVKRFIVILAGVAAAIGPLLALAGTILPAISTGFALLTGPVGLIAAALAAIAVIVIKNWAPIKKVIIDVANYFIDLYNESDLVRIAVEGVALAFKNAFEVGKFAFETLKSIITSFLDRVISGFKTFGGVLKAVLTGNLDTIPDIIAQGAAEGVNNFKGFTQELAANWKQLTDNIAQNGREAIDNIVQRRKIEFLEQDVDASGLEDSVSKAVSSGVASGISGIGANSGSGSGGAGARLPETALDISGLAEGFNPIAPIAENIDEQIRPVDEALLILNERMQQVRDTAQAVGGAVSNAFGQLSQNIVGALNLADDGFQGFVKGLISTVTQLIQIMLAQSISQAIAGATASGTATGPLAIFTTPGFIATAVGGVLSAFAAIPKFEDGGIVGGSSFYGDKILARVNSGELILNQEQQRSLYNQLNNPMEAMQPVVMDVVLRGEDLILSQERTNRKISRRS